MKNYFILGCCGFLFLSNCSEAPINSRIDSIINVLDLINKSKVSQSQLSPTEKHFGEVKEEIENACDFYSHFKPFSKEQFMQLIQKCIEKEKQYSDFYTVFYHAQNMDWFFYTQFISALGEWLKNMPHETFLYLRCPIKKYEVTESIIPFVKKFGLFGQAKDTSPEIGQFLVATNLSLLANIGFEKESSLMYAFFNQSCKIFYPKSMYPDIQEWLLQYKKQMPINVIEEAFAEFKKRFEAIESGVLQQIFIPKDLAKNISYICGPQGRPLCREQNEEAQKIEVEKAFKEPSAIGQQCRLACSNKGLLSPENNIIFYTYVLPKYQEQFDKARQEFRSYLYRLFDKNVQQMQETEECPKSYWQSVKAFFSPYLPRTNRAN